MRRSLIIPLIALGLVGAAFSPPMVRAASRADAAVGVWVQRNHPSDDMAGARVVVTATHARPSRQVLTGDGEGMAFTELQFTSGAESTQVTITPVVPDGMRLDSGGCDRQGINHPDAGGGPFDVPVRNGYVVMTIGNRQSASCVFFLGPSSSAPDTSTATPTAPARPATPSTWLALAAALVAVTLCLRRTAPRRQRR